MIEHDNNVEMLSSEITAQKLTDGFGFGEGTISYSERKSIAGIEAIAAVEKLITSNDILVAVDKDKDGNIIDDDGCGDGRRVKIVREGTSVKKESLHRSKVFGGSTAMATGAAIGMGSTSGTALQEVFSSSIEQLKEREIDFGAHTDDHQWSNQESQKSGCGAIDMAPVVIAKVVEHREKIKESIAALGADTSRLDEVLDNFGIYTEQIKGQPFTGKKVVSEIVDNGKIVKELEDEHCEAFIVLNTIENQTINQAMVRDVSGDTVQVFGIDVWRMQALAARLYPTDDAAANQAFLGELAYTLGVSATLTAGDLPVYLVTAKE